MLLMVVMTVMTLTSQVFAAYGYTPATGVTVDVTSSSSDSMSNGAITVKVKGSGKTGWLFFGKL